MFYFKIHNYNIVDIKTLKTEQVKTVEADIQEKKHDIFRPNLFTTYAWSPKGSAHDTQLKKNCTPKMINSKRKIHALRYNRIFKCCNFISTFPTKTVTTYIHHYLCFQSK